MRALLIALALLAPPALSQTKDHLAEKDGLRVLHAWTPAAAKGTEALIYLEVENTSPAPTTLTGGNAMGQPLDLVGFSYGAAGEDWTILPGLPVPAGADLHLEPEVLALRWTDLPADLAEGGDLRIDVHLGPHALPVAVEIGAADATGHSHAGHGH